LKYLIVGLGNIGQEYDHTRHNIGFEVLDHLASENGLQFSAGRLAYTAHFSSKGRQFYLVKPTTYMNLSGKATRYWLNKLKLTPDRLLVIVDDVNLPLGHLRLKPRGSDGGHNGLKDIQALLGTMEYPRLRFGIGNDFPKGQQVDYVLGKWTPEEWEQIQPGIKTAAKIVLNFGWVGIERTMNQFNTKTKTS